MIKILMSAMMVLNLGLFVHSQTISATFSIPDTVCVNQTFTVQNTSTGNVTSNYWNFCLNPNAIPSATNLGNPGGTLSWPVYYTIGKDGNDYYVFVSNNSPGGLVRFFYGSSLLNTPTLTMLGNLGNVLPNNFEDLHLELQGGTWYGIAVGSIGGAVYRLTFGNSLANTPTAVNMGNIGGMAYPQRLQIFWSGGNCYGFTPNRDNHTVTRFNFGTSIANTPTGTNLGNLGIMNTCTDMSVINFNGNWYAYVINEGSNTITRLDFGTSLLNIPTGVNLGNTGALNGPRGIDVYVECGEVKGLIVNRFGNDLLKMTFPSGPTGNLVTTSYGNIGGFSWPHSIERYRVGDTLYAMIPNLGNYTLSRIYYPGCNNSAVPSSTLQNPPPVSYNQPGSYYINYIANESQINQAAACKKIVVLPTNTLSSQSKTICQGASITLSATGAPNYSWSTSQSTPTIQVSPSSTTVYTVQGWNYTGCKSLKTVQVTVNTCVGIQEANSINMEVDVFPNPSNGSFIVKTEHELELKLFNLVGERVRIISLNESNGFENEVSELSDGVYFLIGEAALAKVRKKVVVLK